MLLYFHKISSFIFCSKIIHIINFSILAWCDKNYNQSWTRISIFMTETLVKYNKTLFLIKSHKVNCFENVSIWFMLFFIIDNKDSVYNGYLFIYLYNLVFILKLKIQYLTRWKSVTLKMQYKIINWFQGSVLPTSMSQISIPFQRNFNIFDSEFKHTYGPYS